MTEEKSLAKDLGILEALTIGIGTMIGAGIFVLPGIVAEKAGPAAILSFVIGGVIALLVALSLSELATGMPKAGGSYYYVNQALGPLFGTIIGYGMWFGLMFACAFYMIGFGKYVAWFLPLSEKFTALIVFALLTLINYIGAKETGKTQNIIVIGLVAILILFVVWGLFKIDVTLFQPFFPHGTSPVFGVAGMLFITYMGFEVIATVGEEIKNPKRNIPAAMLGSIACAGLFYILVMLVCVGIVPYKSLGQTSTPVAVVAKIVIGSAGASLMVAGAVLATVSSANASILSASRVNFAMGRDKLISEQLNIVHSKFLTPYRSILVTALFVFALIVIGKVKILASAASFLYLMGHALVHVSCIIMRNANLEWYKPKFRSPGYPWVQIVGFLSCVVIILSIDRTAQLIGWGIVGLAIIWYLAWAKNRVLARGALARALMLTHNPQAETAVLSEKGTASHSNYKILLPLANPNNLEMLTTIASCIAKKHEGKILAMNIIPVPHQTALSAARQHFKKTGYNKDQILLESAEKISNKFGVEMETRSVLSHDISKTIQNIAVLEECDLILLGWRGWTQRAEMIMGSIIDPVVNNAPCDIVVVKVGPLNGLKKILLPTAGGPQFELTADVAFALAKQFDASITGFYVAPEEYKELGERRLSETLKRAKGEPSISKKIVVSDSVMDALIDEAQAHDLVVIGATKEGIFQQFMFGSIPENLAKNIDKTVVLAKRFEGPVKSLLKRAANLLRLKTKSNWKD